MLQDGGVSNRELFGLFGIWHLKAAVLKVQVPFLESPETLQARFGWHDSLYIFKTKALQLFLFLFPLQRLKRPALQNKQVVLLRMAREVLGTFEKRAQALGG